MKYFVSRSSMPDGGMERASRPRGNEWSIPVPFFKSLTKEKSKKIFLVSFLVSTLLPILLAIAAGYHYVLPLLDVEEVEKIRDAAVYGLVIILIFPLLTFFLMNQWLRSLERVTSEITAKTMEVSDGQRAFADQKLNAEEIIQSGGDYLNALQETEENEIQSLVKAFNNIFQTAADQIAERERIRDLLGRLIAVSSDLTSELDFDRLFPLIIGKVTEVMAAERTSLYVIDWERREIWTKVAMGIGQIRLPLGEGISGRVAQSGKMLNVADAWELPYFNRSYDELHQFRTKSVLCIPIKGRRNRPIGVLQVINKKGGNGFGTEDEILIKGLASQVGVGLENSLLVDELRVTFEKSISSLSATVDAKHASTAGHSERVTEYSLLIARQMKLSDNQCEMLKYAALLHDIGKIGIRDDVLVKNGPFSPEEWQQMQLHPLKTKSILDKFHFPEHLRRIPEIAVCHHEHIDGRGYPSHLKGNEIPLEAKIIAVADVFDALTSKRDYPKYAKGEVIKEDRIPIAKAVDILRNEAGTHFDPFVVAAFEDCLIEALLRYRGDHFPSEYVEAYFKAT
jgi:HD-GYP domain-containing protein (c-di-GMP phosphodiesterase class II)